VYVFYTVELPPEAVQKIEASLNITDEVIRFLITRVDIKGIAKAEAAKEEKAKRAAERGETPESSKEDAQTDAEE
jgi:ribosomal protein S6